MDPKMRVRAVMTRFAVSIYGLQSIQNLYSGHSSKTSHHFMRCMLNNHFGKRKERVHIPLTTTRGMGAIRVMAIGCVD